MEVLALSGSLRAASINSAFCRTAARLARPSFEVTLYEGLGVLPLFNPDLEASIPDAVMEFRRAVAAADVLVIASPEYAHGISGVMKNALDWLVAFEAAAYKPVAVINTSPRASHAYSSLCEVLTTMSMPIISNASLAIPLLGSCVTENAMLSSEEVRRSISTMYDAIEDYFTNTTPSGPSFRIG
jgi:NAD(P)H-dependent FMN reductase